MRIRLTAAVDSHHTNPDYSCVVVDFFSTDSNFRVRQFHSGRLADWLPTDQEILDLFSQLYDMSPTFRSMFRSEMAKKGVLIPQQLGEFF
jgi:hypothetical protein